MENMFVMFEKAEQFLIGFTAFQGMDDVFCKNGPGAGWGFGVRKRADDGNQLFSMAIGKFMGEAVIINRFFHCMAVECPVKINTAGETDRAKHT